MLRLDSQSLNAPGVGARILIIRNDASIAPTVKIQNRDTLVSAAISYEEGNGTTWSTVSGSQVSVGPGLSDGQTVVSSERFIALFAQGNVDLEVHVTRQYNGPVTEI